VMALQVATEAVDDRAAELYGMQQYQSPSFWISID